MWCYWSFAHSEPAVNLLFIWTVQVPFRTNAFILYFSCSWIFSFLPECLQTSFLLKHGANPLELFSLSALPQQIFLGQSALALHYICPESDTGCSRQISLNLCHPFLLFHIQSWVFLPLAVRSHLNILLLAAVLQNTLWRLAACSSSLTSGSGRILQMLSGQ